MPFTNWRWKIRKTTITGTTMMRLPAAMSSYSAVRPLAKMYKPVASGLLSLAGQEQ
jgi:hypothetical protein